MSREEKINLIKELLKKLMFLPENSWLSELDAKEIFDSILKLNDEDIDKSIILLTEALEKIWLKIKNTNNKVNKIIISDNEEFEKNEEQKELNNLFFNF